MRLTWAKLWAVKLDEVEKVDGRWRLKPELEAAAESAINSRPFMFEKVQYPARDRDWFKAKCRQCREAMLRRSLTLGGLWVGLSAWCSTECEKDHQRAMQRERDRRWRQRNPRPSQVRAATERRCQECDGGFMAKRSDAKYCSARCRKRVSVRGFAELRAD